VTSIPSYEFCAFGFLTQWLESELELHAAISSAPTENDIRKALAYFQVARTFKGLASPSKIALILQSLIDVRNDRTLKTPDEKVEALAHKFQNSFHRLNLSAASKLLWLSCREPFIIYDTRAAKALSHHFGHRFNDYTEYSNAWRKEYARAADSIRAAIQQLPKGRIFMRSCSLTDQELLNLAKEVWFTERVFDVFLWEVGIKENA
jgi:hypothetical protein